MRDPVCMMEVGLREAGSMAVHQGRGYYFCSEGCKNRFIANPGQFQSNVQAERLTLGVMGSAGNEGDDELLQRAYSLGQTIAGQGLILITGACPGLPHACAVAARAHGGISVGISPALSLDEHMYTYHSPADAFDVLVYTGSGLMGREVTNIRSSDMVVIIGGRSGTLGEFAIAYDEGKLIGVLQGSGGITEEIPDLVESFGKDTGAVLIYDSDPDSLIQKLVQNYSENHYRQPSCFCLSEREE